MKNKLYVSNSDKKTQDLGEKFAKSLKPGDVVFLYGDLGFGKTTFVKGVAKGLGVTSMVLSPTFPIIRKHDNVYHIDLYRIKTQKEIQELGIMELLQDNLMIKLIEWPEILNDLGLDKWNIHFKVDDQENRTLKISYG